MPPRKLYKADRRYIALASVTVAAFVALWLRGVPEQEDARPQIGQAHSAYLPSVRSQAGRKSALDGTHVAQHDPTSSRASNSMPLLGQTAGDDAQLLPSDRSAQSQEQLDVGTAAVLEHWHALSEALAEAGPATAGASQSNDQLGTAETVQQAIDPELASSIAQTTSSVNNGTIIRTGADEGAATDGADSADTGSSELTDDSVGLYIPSDLVSRVDAETQEDTVPKVQPDDWQAAEPEQSSEVLRQSGGTDTPVVDSTADSGGLLQRSDNHCTAERPPVAEMSEQERREVFQCRQLFAQQLAVAACDEQLHSPPMPRFVRTQLNISRLEHGLQSHARPVPETIDIAVEEADSISNAIVSDGTWDLLEVRSTLAALERASKRSSPALLLDLGAHLGTYTFAAAALGYPVLAFEALPRNVAALHQTLCWNPELRERVTVFPYGIGRMESACMALSETGNRSNGKLVCGADAVTAQGTLREQQVQGGGLMEKRGVTHTVTLGGHLIGAPQAVSVMKTSLMGFEPQLFESAGSALDSLQYAISELDFRTIQEVGQGTFAELALQYLREWEDRGFGVRVCGEAAAVGQPACDTCFHEEVDTAENAVRVALGMHAAAHVALERRGAAEEKHGLLQQFGFGVRRAMQGKAVRQHASAELDTRVDGVAVRAQAAELLAQGLRQ